MNNSNIVSSVQLEAVEQGCISWVHLRVVIKLDPDSCFFLCFLEHEFSVFEVSTSLNCGVKAFSACCLEVTFSLDDFLFSSFEFFFFLILRYSSLWILLGCKLKRSVSWQVTDTHVDNLVTISAAFIFVFSV